MKLKLPAPGITPVLDPHFRPASLFWRKLRQSGLVRKIQIAIEQPNGAVFARNADLIIGDDPETDAANYFLLKHLVRESLWTFGGYLVHIHGAGGSAKMLKHFYYAYDACGLFDAQVMGPTIYGRQFEVVIHDSLESFPVDNRQPKTFSRNEGGCRLVFDLGQSNFRAGAVMNGEVVFSRDNEWASKDFSDPEQHFEFMLRCLTEAAGSLPRVDAIGGSSAGVMVDCCPRIASWLRGIPPEKFQSGAVPLFRRIQSHFGGAPMSVENDGLVAALAAAVSLNKTGVLGIAMGSSQAAGWFDQNGQYTSQLDEGAFVPIDLNPLAPADEWSGFRGCGALYHSQQALPRLIAQAGLICPAGLDLPGLVKHVHGRLNSDDADSAKAEQIFRTIGTYLGYAVAGYFEVYPIRLVYLMGRIVEGRGGDIVVETALSVLAAEFPELAEQIEIRLPDAASRTFGQMVAAAFLPKIG